MIERVFARWPAGIEKESEMSKEAKAKVAKAGLPAGWVEIDGSCVREAEAALVEAVLRAWEVKGKIEALKEDFDAWCEEIKKHLGAPASVVVEGVCRAIYAQPKRVAIADAEMLESVLGGRYLDLVKVEEKVSATEGLIELVLNADDPLGRAIRPALKITTGESVTLKAERPAKEGK